MNLIPGKHYQIDYDGEGNPESAFHGLGVYQGENRDYHDCGDFDVRSPYGRETCAFPYACVTEKPSEDIPMNIGQNPTVEMLERLLGTKHEIAPNVVHWADGSLWVLERDFYPDWSVQHSQYVDTEFTRATRIPNARYFEAKEKNNG